ncbi:cytochrome P450 6B2-like [Pieris napi]|uniref:cytochrome P450 6B2-like n=1 Tax=Pieris napi TaxID=78633 RepID=UPI001FBBCFA2|nr:cytochrome P450 6B2-like [Pieris napi]
MAVTAVLLAFLGVLLSIFYYWSQYKFDYWKKRNVPHLQPTPLFGNYKEYILMKKFLTEVVNGICEKFPKEPYFGAFVGTEPALIVKDPDYIKLILTKDFYYFNSREIAEYSHKEVIGRNIFFTSGDNWKILRQNVTPLFSSAKMKKMFYLIEECSDNLDKVLFDLSKKPSVEVRSLMSRFTIDCIGSCAFGVKTEAMKLDESNNPFVEIGRKIFEASNVRGIKAISRIIWPSIFYNLGFKAFPSEAPEFFSKLLTNVFEQRQYKNSGRHDFVDLVLGLKAEKFLTGDSISNLKGEKKKTTLEVNHDLLSSQCVLFFAAGFETSATTLSFILFEMAKNPEIQKRVLDEVDHYFSKNNKISYECVSETPLLDACINETLRLYPVLGVLTRELVEDYKLPSGVLLNKGVRIHIPVQHIQRNPEYFPDPDVFRPERFMGNEKENIKPFTYMPFGDGPRTCIGMRFAKMQMTAGLLTILRKVRVELAPDTRMTVELEPRSLTTQPKHGINLKFVPR